MRVTKTQLTKLVEVQVKKQLIENKMYDDIYNNIHKLIIGIKDSPIW